MASLQKVQSLAYRRVPALVAAVQVELIQTEVRDSPFLSSSMCTSHVATVNNGPWLAEMNSLMASESLRNSHLPTIMHARMNVCMQTDTRGQRERESHTDANTDKDTDRHVPAHAQARTRAQTHRRADARVRAFVQVVETHALI